MLLTQTVLHVETNVFRAAAHCGDDDDLALLGWLKCGRQGGGADNDNSMSAQQRANSTGTWR